MTDPHYVDDVTVGYRIVELTSFTSVIAPDCLGVTPVEPWSGNYAIAAVEVWIKSVGDPVWLATSDIHADLPDSGWPLGSETFHTVIPPNTRLYLCAETSTSPDVRIIGRAV